MAKKLDRMYQLFQENVSQGMVDDLADRLHVDSDSILELGAGYAPIVEFSRGPSHLGWWGFPERDAKGKLVGLGLRHEKDVGDPLKAMFPSANRGLIYAVNPMHQLGQPVYKPGKHNWVRTMDAGVSCPVCGKPDGCLISSDDPDNPSAAICIRIETGSVKEVKGGGSWLHNLSGQSFASNTGILPHSNDPVVVVEGATDTLAGMSLGLVTVGKPNAKGGLAELSELLRGRRVIVMGENDKKDDGSCPGREGMMMTAQVLQRVCKDVLKVMPPGEWKDLRKWRAGTNLTKDDFLAYCEERGDRTQKVTLLPDDRPRTAGTSFLNDEYMVNGRYLVRQQIDTLYRYTGNKYEAVTPKEVTGKMYSWAHERMHVVDTTKGPKVKPIKADRAWVANVLDSIVEDIRIDRDLKAPAWINGKSGADPHEVIPFENGLLHLPSYVAGKDVDECLMDNTPDYFNVVCLPYAFDPTARCDDFMEFIHYALPPEDIKLLRQWMGYCLVWDNQFQKFMLMLGVKRSGKSTVLNLIADLVGLKQYAGPSFADLTGKYAMGDLVGKLVLGIDEADVTRTTDIDAIVSILKVLSGDSPQKTEKKYQDAESANELRARITMTANETPRLPDNADAIARRMLILQFNREAEVEDPKLRQKFKNELPGIALWALGGLKEIYTEDERGNPEGFTESETSLRAKREWSEHANPMRQFYEDCCEHSPGEMVSMSELVTAFNAYHGERGGKSWITSRIQERLKLVAPLGVNVGKVKYKTGKPMSVMENITLQAWAEEEYLQGGA